MKQKPAERLGPRGPATLRGLALLNARRSRQRRISDGWAQV